MMKIYFDHQKISKKINKNVEYNTKTQNITFNYLDVDHFYMWTKVFFLAWIWWKIKKDVNFNQKKMWIKLFKIHIIIHVNLNYCELNWMQCTSFRRVKINIIIIKKIK